MVRVCVYCMQKNEEDILESWILYHSYLFGMTNIYIIDNFSNKTSLDILHKYEQKGLHVSQQPDYALKGVYLYELIKQTQELCDLAIPLDLDEFVAMVDLNNMVESRKIKLASACMSFNHQYYVTKYPQVLTEAHNPTESFHHFITKGYSFGWDGCAPDELKTVGQIDVDTFFKQNGTVILKHYPHETLSCNKDLISQHLNSLPKYGRYSFLYYLTSRSNTMRHNDPIIEIKQFDLVDYEHYDGKLNLNKKFFDPHKLNYLDHGNHHGKVEGLSPNQYINSQLVLLHYHNRGVKKLIEKCKNDIIGLHIINNINDQRELNEKIKQNVTGAHNIKTYLTYLTSGPGSLMVYGDDGFNINQLSIKMLNLEHME